MENSYPSIEALDRKKYPPYGKCIYCDALENLRTEHIIPFGLGGTLELPESTCKLCADETSRVERCVLRGELWPVRIHRAFQSRRRHRHAPNTLPLTVIRNGVEELVQLPIEEFPILVPFLQFAPARIAVGEPSKPGIDVSDIVTVSFGPDPFRVIRDLGATSIKPYVLTHPLSFARMLAKIAYSMAAATGALTLIKGVSPIRDVILGKNPNIGDFVGTLTNTLSKHGGHLHRVIILPDVKLRQLVADVQLFSDSHSPRYGVLLGELAHEYEE